MALGATPRNGKLLLIILFSMILIYEEKTKIPFCLHETISLCCFYLSYPYLNLTNKGEESIPYKLSL